jgi:hypothetical protein
MKRSIEIPQKTKTRITICPAIPLLGIYLKDVSQDTIDTCMPMFIAALFTTAKP